jgi:superfamily II DNA or RNA helicase
VLIPTVIDTHLRVDGNLLGHDLANRVFDELTLINPEWIEAKKRNAWDLEDIPKWIILGELGTGTATNGDEIVMPRGYAMEYKLLLREHGHRVKWIDRRKWARGPRFGVQEFSYRDHQPPAVAAILKHQFGIYEAPTGSGKTTVGCAVIWRTQPRKSHILVDKIELIYQWRRMLIQHAGVPEELIGQIGDGKWDERRITIATVQTLRRREDEIPQSWYDDVDLMILDECHHVTAESIQKLVQRYRARIRIGMSATPDRQDMRFNIALDILGDVFYSDAEDDLREAGIITAPKVFRIRTNFKYAYWGDHRSDKRGNCDKPGCKISSQHAHKNNYQKMLSALEMSRTRNALVSSCLLAQINQGPHVHLVISDHVEHLKALMAAFEHMAGSMKYNGSLPPRYFLTGQTPKKERREILEALSEAEDAVLFSTVAKEGLDIPQIDRIYLPFPGKQPAATEQKIGRGTRAMVGKGETWIFDFADLNVAPLSRQFRSRRYKVYDKLGLEVVL